MLICLLCLKKKSKSIKLGSKKGKELNCSEIIAQHFWLKPSIEEQSTESICLPCWNVLLAFHQLYQIVAKAHNYFESEISNSNELEQEVKLEFDTLELLQKVEAYETVVADNQINLCPLELVENCLTKQEPNPIYTNNSSDDDSETEIPLAMLRVSNVQETEKDLSGKLESEDEATKFNAIPMETMQTASDSDPDNDFLVNDEDFKEEDSDDSSNESHSDADSNYEPTEEDLRRVYTKRKKSTKQQDENIAKVFEKLECFKCKISFPTFSELSQHSETAHNKTPTVVCCERTFHLSTTLSCHALFHLDPKNVKCSYCNHVFKENSLLEKHLETDHKCNLCLETFPNRKELEQHKLIVHSIQPEYKFACKLCDNKYTKKASLAEHKRTAHGKEACCEICGTVVSSKRFLYRHMRKHREKPIEAVGPFECDICGKWIKYRNNLKKHKEWVHEKRYEFVCPTCKKIFASENSLKGHIMRMHTTKSFPCTMCDNVCRSDYDLKQHINTHTREKQYVCEICSGVFLRKGSLKKHIQNMHSNQPKLRVQCEICSAWLNSPSYLKTHIRRMHEKSNEKYPCPVCGRESVNQISLLKHIKRNHGAQALKVFRNANKEVKW